MFDTKWGPISIGICYDTYQFPELMRYYVNKGSRLYLNPTAVVEEVTLTNSRQGFINYYAPTLEYGVICNTIFIASSNLTGWDKINYFGGGSCVIGPKIDPTSETDVTYYAGDKDNVQAEMFIATIDLSLATRRLCVDNDYVGKPDFRPDVYRNLL
jgi:predicted amidohydrolase